MLLEGVDERGDEEGRGQRGHRLEQLRLGLDPADLLDEPVRVRGRHLVLEAGEHARGREVEQRFLDLTHLLSGHGAAAQGLDVERVDGEGAHTVRLRLLVLVERGPALRPVAVEDRHGLVARVGRQLDGLGVLVDRQLVLAALEALVAALLGPDRLLHRGCSLLLLLRQLRSRRRRRLRLLSWRGGAARRRLRSLWRRRRLRRAPSP
mmetsp:Transcript_9019/g.21329  ORF Transcript_9019/g.21329 Transcript_9019/m.21329 type:complete len:207 (-) Transcript_9019:116-736(-)